MFEFFKPKKEQEPKTEFTDEELLVEIKEKEIESNNAFKGWQAERHYGNTSGNYEKSLEARRVYKELDEELRGLRLLARERGLLDEDEKKEGREGLDEAA